MTFRLWRTAGAVSVVLLGAWAGTALYSAESAGGRTAAGGAATVPVPAGEASPPSQSDLDAPSESDTPVAAAIPEKLPEFSLGDQHGKLTAISAWRGKSLILNFWATWCAPCRREIPLLEALRSEWAGRGMEIVGIAVDHRDRVVAYADELKIAYPLLIGEQDALDAASALGLPSPVFPFTVFTDRRGEVVTLFLGELHRPQADLILSVVQNLDHERLRLPEARRDIAAGLAALAHPAG